MINSPSTYWRMWLLGTLSMELNVDLTTLYGAYDDRSSALGQQLRGTVDSLAAFAQAQAETAGDDMSDASTDAANLLAIAQQAANELVRRFKPADPVVSRNGCEVCDE